MPLEPPVSVSQNYDNGTPTFPASLKGPYVIVISGGGLDDAPSVSTPFRPDLVTSDGRRILRCLICTTLIVQAFYDAAATTPAGGTYAVFGRYNGGLLGTTPAGNWTRMLNANGDGTRTPNYDTVNDASDGVLKYTSPNRTTDAFDTLSYNEFLFVTTSAHTVGTGSAARAGLQVGVL